MKYILAILFLIFCNTLFAQNEPIATLESEIEKHLFKKPDSAKIYLKQLLNYSDKRHDTLVAITYSKLGITYSQLAKYDSSAYFFDQGIRLAEKAPILKADIYSNSGINYRHNAEYEKSIAALNNAMELYQKYGDRSGEGVVYGEIGSNYSYMGEKEKAIIYLEKAIEIFKETGDNRLYILQQKLANIYYNAGNYEFAIDLYEQILPEFEKEKRPSYYLTLLSYAESLAQVGKTKEGEMRLIEARDGLAEIKNLEYSHVAIGKLAKIYQFTNRPSLAQAAYEKAYQYLQEIHSVRLLQIASDYLKFLNSRGEYEKAVSVIKSVKNSTHNYEDAMNAQDELSFLLSTRETYRNLGEFEKSLNVFDRIDYLKDSVQKATDQIKIKQLEETYQNKIQREKNIALQSKNDLLEDYNSKQRTFIILSLLLTVLILALSIVIFSYNKKRLAFQKEAVANLEKANIALKENQELEKELFAEKEKNLLDKERELVAVSLEVADIQKQITDIIDTSDEEISANAANKIKTTLNQLNYWKHFKTKFIEINPEFGYNLTEMFPNLSEDDIAFCSLLKLQLSNEEISALMGISKESVLSRKYIVQNKMNLEDNEAYFEELIGKL